MLGQTAKLEFKLVDMNALPSDVMAGNAPPGSQIYPYAADSPNAGQFIAVRRLGVTLHPDPSRVLLRAFSHGDSARARAMHSPLRSPARRAR